MFESAVTDLSSRPRADEHPMPLDVAGAPAVSVIIPCRNEVRDIECCLRSVLAFDNPPGGFEVLLVDGMSDDGTHEIVARIAGEDPRLRLLDNPRRVTPAGLNVGIAAARGELIARVDAHTEYATDYLCQCVEVMRETGADNVGGPALTRGTSYIHRAIAAAYHCRVAVGNAVFHQPGYAGPADTVPYGCYHRARLLNLGLFDEELIRNQDDELNFRLLRTGGTIWQSPRIRSWYTPRDSLTRLFQQYWQYGYWKVRVIQKHRAVASWRHLVPGSFAALLTILTLAAPLLPLVRIALGFLVMAYMAVLLMAAIVTARRAGWLLLPVLPAVFACYHLGYGFGFLLGILHSMTRRRASGRLLALTR
jgi:succinoglycan biosynthesis protein ExoA